MRYAIIENNEVVNIINANADFISANGFNAIELQDEFVDIGWQYIDGQFYQATPKKVVPDAVTPRQIRLAMHKLGILSTIESAVRNSPSDEVKIAWDYATFFYRKDPMLAAMAPALGMTEDQVDDLFILAESI